MRLERPIFLAPVGIGGFKHADTALFPEGSFPEGSSPFWMSAADAEALVEQMNNQIEGCKMMGHLLGPSSIFAPHYRPLATDLSKVSHFVTKIWVDQDIMAEIEVLEGTEVGDVLAKHIRQGGEVELWPRIVATTAPTSRLPRGHFDSDHLDFVAGTCDVLTIDCWALGSSWDWALR